MFKKKRMVILIKIIVFLVVLYSIGYASTEKTGLLIPIGRLLKNNNKVQLSINSKPFEPEVIEDGSGGFWFKIPFDKLQKKDQVNINIVKTNSNTLLYEGSIDQKKWTAPCPLINSDNPDIAAKAEKLTKGCNGNNEKAKKVLDFVVNQIKFELYPGMHYSTASATLKKGYGICVNHSRLFVALCRAAGIPARTVSGTMIGEEKVYSHHEWVEFYDDDRNWHPLEPSFSTDFNFVDLKRIDLIYDIESNPIYSFADGWETDRVKLKNGDISIFCSNWSLQELTGQMSYKMLNDKYPESVEVEVEYDMSKYID
jgi:hypothetical protein